MTETKRIDGVWQSISFRKDQKEIGENVVEILKNVHIFEDLSRRELRNIARISYRRNYEIGESIIIEGQDAAGMYIIVEGEVGVTTTTDDGTEIDLATLGSGTFFGDVGLLDSSRRTATVRAVCESSVIGFFRPELLDLMDSDPKLTSKVIFKLAQVVAARLRLTNRELQNAQNEIDQLRSEK